MHLQTLCLRVIRCRCSQLALAVSTPEPLASVLVMTATVNEGRLQAAWLRRATRSTRCSCCLGIPIWITLPRIRR
jgi:hypothetical protein